MRERDEIFQYHRKHQSFLTPRIESSDRTSEGPLDKFLLLKIKPRKKHIAQGP